MSKLTVGPSGTFSTIEAAVASAQSGDTIAVQGGTYTNDFITITKNLTLEAVGGPVDLVATISPPNGKAIIDEGVPGITVSISGFDISGAAVADQNGAGIRYEGGSLTLEGDTVHGNQNGILANADPNGSVTIDHSVFYDNGAGDGYSHNIYIAPIATLTVENSKVEAAVVGHDIKSRAATTIITNDTIGDGPTGHSSYEIDLPNGGNATVSGNTIEQGPNAANSTLISYGEEGGLYAGGGLTVQNNTLLNDDQANVPVIVINDTSAPVTLAGNSLYGWQTPLAIGPSTTSGNTVLTTEPTFDSSLPCYCAGTRIETVRGAVVVESLVVGDWVVTAAGPAEQVRWIGRRSYAGRFLAGRPALMPVVIRAGALGRGVPQRDLRVSPLHALFIDGVLVPASCLLNGTTVIQERDCRRVDYFHVELRQHDVILAEGAPAESFVDDGSRGLFQNAAEFGGMDEMAPPAYCARRVEGGAELEVIRRRMAASAARAA